MKNVVAVIILLCFPIASAFTGTPVDLSKLFGIIKIVNDCSEADYCVGVVAFSEQRLPVLLVSPVQNPALADSPGKWFFMNDEVPSIPTFKIHFCDSPDFLVCFH